LGFLRINKKKFFDEEHFAGLKWVHPSTHCCDIEPEPLKDNGLSTWFQGQFFAPFAGLFEYAGENGLNVGIDQSKMKVIHFSAPNGLQMFYLPSERVLYGYYHRPKIQVIHDDASLPPPQSFPFGSEELFQAGKVLKIDLKEGSNASVTQVRFLEDFAEHIHATLGTRKPNKGERDGPGVYRLWRADQYIPEESPQLKLIRFSRYKSVQDLTGGVA